MALLADVATCLIRYVLCIIPVVAALLVVHATLPVPSELFRKLLHGVAFCSAPVIMYLSRDCAHPCTVTVLVLVLFGMVVWPLLAFAERFDGYAGLFVERAPHEVRRSLLKLFWGGDALLVGLCWGLLARPMVAATAILMWGFGDAAAALVGRQWGLHHTGLPFADPKKTWEGSGAMWALSTFVGTVCLVVAGMPWRAAFAAAAVTAVAGAYTELVTRGGNDTLSVPYVNALVLTLLTLLGR
jgi:dolichol kinase